MNQDPFASRRAFWCVWPVTKISTPSWRCSAAKLSESPHGTIWWPWHKPILKSPISTVFVSGKPEISSKSPFTTWTLEERLRKNSSCSSVHKFPVQRTWLIRPGTSNFLNAAGIEFERCGMCKSPIINTNLEARKDLLVIEIGAATNRWNLLLNNSLT